MGKWIAGLLIGSLFLVAVTRKQIVPALLGAEQEIYINQLHPSAKTVFRQFIAAVMASGWDVLITSGYRTWMEQASLYSQNSSNSAPGFSYHNYGLAIDINAFDGVTWLRKASTKQAWLNSGIPQIAASFGLTWGGNFANYYDPVHFAYQVATTNVLRQLAINQFGNNPDNIRGNELQLAA